MQTSSLYKALTINERKNNDIYIKKHSNLTCAIPFWKKILNIKKDFHFQDFLRENYNISSEFLSLHFELDKNNLFRSNEKWFKSILKISDSPFDALTSQEEEHFRNFPFYPFYREFIHEFYRSFFSDELNGAQKLLSENCKFDLVMQLLESLYHVSHKTLILEINSLKLQGLLKGNSPEKRYFSFCEILESNADYKRSLVEEYPVLYRLLNSKLQNYITVLKELLIRIIEDLGQIEETFFCGIPSKYISKIKLGTGDTHKGGRSVSIVIFEEGKKVVYKPRSLSIDKEFQNFIDWLNESISDSPRLKSIRFIEKQNYGWSEFVDYKECKSTKEVKIFYRRLGQLLAILHLMNATDFHYENIIANGSNPVLIDLESLFHHAVSSDHKLTKSPAVNKALIAIRDSVISTGLIPSQFQNNYQINETTDEKFDISGVGGRDDQLLPFKVPTIENQYTDEIKIIKRKGTLAPGLNIPKFKGKTVQLIEYLDCLSRGFSSYYKFFMNNKEMVKNRIERFGNKEARKIFRDTMKYAKLLNLSYHPDFQRNQIDREILLNRLWKDVQKEEQMKRLSRYEVNDLLNGDIPYFYSQPQEKKIWSSQDEEITKFYYKSGLELSLEKIENLNEQDLSLQISLINSTISAIYSEKDISMLNFSMKNEAEVFDQKIILGKAAEIGEILLNKAITYEDKENSELCWTSMVMKGMEETSWVYSVTGPGLYDGNTGIAIFFSYLWKLTKNERFKKAAYASMNPIKKLMSELIEPDNISIGGFLGISSILYTMNHMSSLFNDSKMLNDCLVYSREVDRFIEKDLTLDVIGGAAGALFVVTNLYEQTHNNDLLNTAQKLAEHLVKAATPQKTGGVAWPPIQEGKDPYIGFSHGNAGIAASLARYNSYGRNDKVNEIIEKACLYENTFYNKEKNNWYSSHLKNFPIAWCHGSPGILLGRSILKENFHDRNEIRIDISRASRSCLNSSLGKNYSLCHGDLGLIDILLRSNNGLEDPDYTNSIKDLITKVCKNMLSNGEGIQADLNSVGLMNGIAGIGYGLLRIAFPQEVPSVLALDPPVKQVKN